MSKRSSKPSLRDRKRLHLSAGTSDDVTAPQPSNLPSTSSSPSISTTTQTNISSVQPSVEWELSHTFDEHYDRRMKRLERKARYSVRHNFDQIGDLDSFGHDIDTAFYNAVRPFIESCYDLDRVTFNITSDGLVKKIFIKSVPVKDFNPRSFRDAIKLVSQSNTEFLIAKELTVQVNIWHALRGGGRSKQRILTQDEFSRGKKSVVTVRNGNGTDCGYRAITLGVKHYELNVRGNSQMKEWQSIIRYPRTLLNATKGLLNQIDIDEEILYEQLSDVQLRLFDERLSEYQIIVINREDGAQEFIGTDREKVIYLENCGDHYNFIKSMASYRNQNQYCKYCNVGYNSCVGHVCKNGCSKCQAPKPCQSDDTVTRCPDCNFEFKSIDCYHRHEETLCSKRKSCSHCEVSYVAHRGHQCGVYKCQICHENYTIQPHFCFIKTLDIDKLKKEDKINNVLIAYDIEAQLVRKENGEYQHIPFLLVMEMSCDMCKANGCLICEDKHFVFQGEDCVDDFVDKLKDLSAVCKTKKSAITVFAHNNSRYDGHFVFRSMLKKLFRGFDVTMKGLGLMKVEVGNVRFIDSLLLLQAPLAKLPKMFGLSEGGKGFFPYYYRRRVGVIKFGDIPKEEFGYRTMSLGRAEEFNEWYNENKDHVFDYDREAEIYCRNDVRILMQSIQEFRRLFKEKTKLDPLNRAFTIAGVSFEFFRATFMKDNKFHICPQKGYYNHNQSASGNAFLDQWNKDSLEKYSKPVIREYKIGQYSVDGFIDLSDIPEETVKGIVLEYKGCHWHAHDPNVCTMNSTVDIDKTERDNKREALFRRFGYGVIAVWECEYKALLERESNLKRYFKERQTFHYKVKSAKLYCDARDSYKGGLVDSFKFVRRVNEGEIIRYIDFNSLYPHVMCAYPVPVGEPIIIEEDFEEYLPHIEEFFGLISCKVLPPDDVMFPVLHTSIRKKQMYPLCYTCAMNEYHGLCQCSVEDRMIRGKWTSEEIKEALRQGYEIVDIYQMVHYEERDQEMFSKYIKSLYVDKQEASGWPAECQTDEQKVEFCMEFQRRMGVTLDPAKIHSNPGRRTIPKLGMNSGYGKMGQCANMPQTLVTNKRSEAWDLMLDEDKEILSEDRVEDYYIFTYKFVDDSMSTPGNTSVVVAAFITAYARLLLLKEMRLLHESGQEVLYCDTDSIVYVERANSYRPDIGPFLGQLSDEIIGEYGLGSTITEFYTTGPKSYCYRVRRNDGSFETKIKSKGLTLNLDAMESLNFEVIADKALKKSRGEDSEVTLVKQNQFRLNRQHEVNSRSIQKKFNVTADKRMAFGNDTFPFGWRGALPSL